MIKEKKYHTDGTVWNCRKRQNRYP